MEEHPVMPLEVERRGDAVLIRLHGSVSELEAQHFQRELLDHIEQGTVKMVLDLSDVSFVTSTFLGALMLAHKRGRAKGGYVRLVRPQPLVRQILDTTKLTKLFSIYESVQDALDSD